MSLDKIKTRWAPRSMGNGTSNIASEGGTLPEPQNKEEEWGACSALLMDSSSFRCVAMGTTARRHSVLDPASA